ncbi:Multivesicular body subunit 12B [Eumeta japonica]|uniref:Multivesicular body subunit 12A n=1 Tax=Eumeta variegata TaxID=151549 RepID=A0A4C1T4T8_EUMVA|nr:Multivesicular body subunit 12B [Eumeta japonica]
MSVLRSLDGALPDERPLLSLLIIENVAKCPAGYWPVSRTYDEDADAGLLRQNGLFGKKPSHYICLSKTEGVPGYVVDGVIVVGERDTPPPGYGVAGRAGKRRLCTRLAHRTRHPTNATVTDIIVCSRMRNAPDGFMLAGEINGKVVCYKLSGTNDGAPVADYENVISQTPDSNRIRSAPERPPKLTSLVTELNGLNLKTDDDYEALSPTYNINKPSRPAPRPPSAKSPLPSGPKSPQTPSFKSPPSAPGSRSPIAPQRHKKGPQPLPRNSYQTLGGYNGMEGVPFVLNSKLRGVPSDSLTRLPVIKRRTKYELDRDYCYNFTAERQTSFCLQSKTGFDPDHSQTDQLVFRTFKSDDCPLTLYFEGHLFYVIVALLPIRLQYENVPAL